MQKRTIKVHLLLWPIKHLKSRFARFCFSSAVYRNINVFVHMKYGGGRKNKKAKGNFEFLSLEQ